MRTLIMWANVLGLFHTQVERCIWLHLKVWWTLLGRASDKVCIPAIDLVVALALGHSSLIMPLAVFP